MTASEYEINLEIQLFIHSYVQLSSLRKLKSRMGPSAPSGGSKLKPQHCSAGKQVVRLDLNN